MDTEIPIKGQLPYDDPAFRVFIIENLIQNGI